LKARLNDVPEIVSALLSKHGHRKDILTSKMLDKLKCYFWPGNIRELDGLLRRYAVLLDRDKPDYALFKTLFQEVCSAGDLENWGGLTDCDQNKNESLSLRQQVKIFEKSVIDKALQKHSHKRTATARSLGISVNSLWRKTKE
ncbi:MAG: hypothetical protein LC631_07105, partial [Desulfovibrionales bacterium]|nr:hypothetical protein [Desulfovibrionales bacterium]